MSKRALGGVAIVLVIAILAILFIPFDGLPKELKRQITSERQAVATAQKEFQGARDVVSRSIQSEPELFRVRNFSTVLPERLRQAETDLTAAVRDMSTLERLDKEDRKRERAEVEQLLRREKQERESALKQANEVRTEATRLVAFKRDLPQALGQMERDYQTVKNADLGPVSATVQKAESDWPNKKADLDTRLNALQNAKADTDKAWQTVTTLRQQQPPDYAALFAAGETIRSAAGDLTTRTQQLQTLTSQLYDSYDKVLVDLDRQPNETYVQRIKTIRTHITDVAANKTEIKTDENWVEVPKATYQAMERNIGMTIEHKDAGKYDSEANRTPQPAGMAYVAPPGQRNQYGYWSQGSGGTSVWTWLPAYLLLRDHLYNRTYIPPTPYDYQGYRTAQQSGTTYYGQDPVTRKPKFGTLSDSTTNRYAGSRYMTRGGYAGSKYETRGGTYSGSGYSSKGSTNDERYGNYRSGGSTGTYNSRPGGFGSSTYRSAPPSSRPTPRFGGRSYSGRRR